MKQKIKTSKSHIDAGKNITKLTSSHDRNTGQFKKRDKLFDLIKSIYQNPTTNAALYGKRQEALPLRLGTG